MELDKSSRGRCLNMLIRGSRHRSRTKHKHINQKPNGICWQLKDFTSLRAQRTALFWFLTTTKTSFRGPRIFSHVLLTQIAFFVFFTAIYTKVTPLVRTLSSLFSWFDKNVNCFRKNCSLAHFPPRVSLNNGWNKIATQPFLHSDGDDAEGDKAARLMLKGQMKYMESWNCFIFLGSPVYVPPITNGEASPTDPEKAPDLTIDLIVPSFSTSWTAETGLPMPNFCWPPPPKLIKSA